jgi:hypothetical protein
MSPLTWYEVKSREWARAGDELRAATERMHALRDLGTVEERHAADLALGTARAQFEAIRAELKAFADEHGFKPSVTGDFHAGAL